MYPYLDDQRRKLWGLKIDLIKSSVEKAELKHKETVEFQEMLVNNKIEKANEFLINFNFT